MTDARRAGPGPPDDDRWSSPTWTAPIRRLRWSRSVFSASGRTILFRSCGPTSRGDDPTPLTTRSGLTWRGGGARRGPRGRRSRDPAAGATPRPRWSSAWRSSGVDARPPTPRPSRRCRTAYVAQGHGAGPQLHRAWVVTLLEQHFPTLVDYAFATCCAWKRTSTASCRVRGHGAVAEPLLLRRCRRRLPREIRQVTPTSPPAWPSSGWSTTSATSTPGPSTRFRSGPTATGCRSGRVGRYGPYLERGDGDDVQRRRSPTTRLPDELHFAGHRADASPGDRDLGEHPDTGLVAPKAGRFDRTSRRASTTTRPASSPARRRCSRRWIRPRSSRSCRCWSYREVGADPADGVVITTQNLVATARTFKKGTDSRSLDSEDQILTTLDEALATWPSPSVDGRTLPSRR